MTQQPIPNDPKHDASGAPDERAGRPNNRTPLFQANSAARYQRQEMIRQMQSRNGTPLNLLRVGAWMHGRRG